MEISQIDSTITAESAVTGLQWIHMNNTISLIALTLGISIFVISYFAGGKENKSRLVFSVLFALLIGFFSMPLVIKAAHWLGIMESNFGIVFVVTVVMLFVACIAANLYEIVTVTAREARPPK
ncbi:hypothetical protein JXQ31_01440 [candidate division KSB1 bacterium]|nr:hypothetical protein [candidate division KSB1 bacterium]